MGFVTFVSILSVLPEAMGFFSHTKLFDVILAKRSYWLIEELQTFEFRCLLVQYNTSLILQGAFQVIGSCI